MTVSGVAIVGFIVLDVCDLGASEEDALRVRQVSHEQDKEVGNGDDGHLPSGANKGGGGVRVHTDDGDETEDDADDEGETGSGHVEDRPSLSLGDDVHDGQKNKHDTGGRVQVGVLEKVKSVMCA